MNNPSKLNHRTRFLSFVTALLLSSAVAPSTIARQPGDLDPTFGVGGKVIDHVITASGSYAGQTVLVQPDGKIVTVGTSGDGELSMCSATRHLADGTLDQSFGNGGKVLLDLDLKVYCNSAALQSDGKIVAAGYGFTPTYPSGNGVIVVVRMNPDGSLDTSFDGDGIATTNGVNHSIAFAVVIQTDGKIVAAGMIVIINGTSNTHNFALVRYNPDGSLDSSFDGDGIVTTNLGSPGWGAFDVALQQDGKIVAAGLSHTGSNDDFALVRYNSDGSLDTSFDGDGKVTTAVSGTNDDWANSVAIQSDGKIVAGGSIYGSGGTSALVRYNPDGSLDTTFSGDGILVPAVGGSAVAIQSDGKIVANNGSTLGRYDPDGTLDTTFSGDGIVSIPQAGGAGVAIQPDGKIVVGAIVRVNTDGSLDTSFGIGGIVTITLGYGGGSIYGIEVAIQPDGKIVALGTSTVARYNVDGSPDTTFGGTGRVFIGGIAFDVAIQPGGKIVIAMDSDGKIYGELLRLNSDGSLDTSFGTNGIVAGLFFPSIATTLPDGKLLIDLATNLYRLNANGSFDPSFSPCQAGVGSTVYLDVRVESAIQADGKILNVFTFGGSSGFGVFRCNPNGGLDTGFGSGGVATTLMSSAAAQSIAIQSDGKFIVAGQSGTSANTDWKPTLVRYNSNGSLDTGFGAGGIVTAPSTGIDNYPPFTDVVIQADRKIVASSTFGSSLALFRYDPNGSLDTTFGGGDGISTVNFNNSYGNGIALDSQGRAVVVASSWGRLALARFLLEAKRMPFDYDGDGRSDISTFRPSTGVWYLNRSTAGIVGLQWGTVSDKIVPADYDGDATTDIAVYRPSEGRWYIFNSATSTFSSATWGVATDIPTPGDFDNDGRADVAIFRPSDGNWWLDRTTAGIIVHQFGGLGDHPVVGDYDGDGKADIAAFRPATGVWYIFRSTTGPIGYQFGVGTDKVTPADYDGDGKTDIAVYRPSEGKWYIVNSGSATYPTHLFGAATDIPAPGDYDGDGRADIAIFRPSDGNWWIDRTSAGLIVQQFGQNGDKPTPNAFGN